MVRPGDPDYDDARADYNARFSLHPSAIVFCANDADVANAIRWARENGVPLRPRSGRHSYEAYSVLDDGLVIDTSAINAIQVDAAGKHARIGAGAQLIDMYTTLWQSGLTIPSGSCGTLGLAGVVLGGGYGLASRAFGLSCDLLRSADVVTADGQLRTAQGDDLHWALRGGGGGNFGIVTAMEFDLVPVGNVATYSMVWPLADFPRVMSFWQGWAPQTDPRLTSLLAIDAHSVTSSGMLLGAADELSRLLAPLAQTGAQPDIQSQSYLDAVRYYAGLGGHRRPRIPLPQLMAQQRFKNSSAYVVTPFPDAAISALMAQMQAAPGPNNSVLLDAHGGAIAGTDGAATAFPHREALFSMQFMSYWDNDPDAPANVAWTHAVREAMLPWTDGAYVNYVDGEIADFAARYYGGNLARLQSVKRSVDPDGVFQFPQAIPS